MKVKNKTIINFMNSIGLQKLVRANIPVGLRYALAVVVKEASEKTDMIMRQKQKVLEEYCAKDKDGNPITEKRDAAGGGTTTIYMFRKERDGEGDILTQEMPPECQEELDELMEQETLMHNIPVELDLAALDKYQEEKKVTGFHLTSEDIIGLLNCDPIIKVNFNDGTEKREETNEEDAKKKKVRKLRKKK